MPARISIALVCLGILLCSTAPVRAEEGTFPLTVRDGETGRPVPGATVNVILPAVLRAERLLPSIARGDVGVLARRHGVAAVADANGVAALPRAALEMGWCAVEHEGRFGASSFYDPDLEEVHELEIFADVSVRLRVVGPDDDPAGGIPVSLRRAAGHGFPFLWRGTSEADTGEVLVTHVDWRFRRHALSRCLARIEVPGTEVEAEVVRPLGDEAPLVLRLPPTGRVRVGPKGAGAGGRLHLTLRAAPLAPWTPAVEHDVLQGEDHVFPHVGLGGRFRVDVHPFDDLYRDAEPLVFDGPAEAGAEVVATPVVEAQNVLVVARVVDEKGQPVRGASFHAWMRAGSSSGLAGVRTDEEGRFRYVVDASFGMLVAPDAPATLELVPKDQSMAGDSRVHIELPRPFRPGVTDFGDVVLPSAPVVLSGIVVDAAGSPVAGVYVFVFQGREPTPEDAGWRCYSPRPVASDEKDEDPTWLWSPQLRAISDEHGGFVMTGELLEGQPCRFAIHKPGYEMRAPQVAQPGATDARVVLERAGRIEGAIRLPPWLGPKWLYLALRGRPAAAAVLRPGSWGTKDPPPDDVGEVVLRPGWGALGQVNLPMRDCVQPFVFTGLRPGVATFAVCIDNDPDPIATFDGLRVAEGEVTRDPRFDPLDVTELVRSTTLSITTTSGTPLAGLEVRLFRGRQRQTARVENPQPSPDGSPVRTTFASGVASRLDLEVRAPGFRAIRLEDVRGDHDVRLEPGIPIQVILPRDWGSAGETSGSCTATPVRDESKRYFRFVTDPVSVGLTGTDGEAAHLVLPTPGRWHLILQAGAREAARTTVSVRADTTDEQSFTFIR